MSPSTIGTHEISRGQLITFYVKGVDGGRDYLSMFHAKRSFSMSGKMVEYYNSLSDEEKSQPCEKTADGLYRLLLKEGFVELVKNDVIDLGVIGRPSARVADEVRYSINPENYHVEKLKEELEFSNSVFFNHQGYRVMLLGQSSSLNTAIIEMLDEDGVVFTEVCIGMIFDNTVDIGIDNNDTEKLKETVLDMVRRTGFHKPVTLGKVNYNFMEST